MKNNKKKFISSLFLFPFLGTMLTSCARIGIDEVLNPNTSLHGYDRGMYIGKASPYKLDNSKVVTKLDTSNKLTLKEVNESYYSPLLNMTQRRYLSESNPNILVVPVEFKDVSSSLVSFETKDGEKITLTDKNFGESNSRYEEIKKDNFKYLKLAMNGSKEKITEASKEVEAETNSTSNFSPDSLFTNNYISVKDFYSKSSYNKVNLNIKVLDDPVISPLSLSEILNKAAKLPTSYSPLKDIEMIARQFYKDCFEDKVIKSDNEILNFEDFDTDKDGKLDSVIFVYNALDINNIYNDKMKTISSIKELLWHFTSYFSPISYSKDPNFKFGNFTFSSYTSLYQGIDNCVEENSSSTQGSPFTLPIDSHILIHEIGHLFGLPDFYDNSNKKSNEYRSPLGGNSMMDLNILDFDPFSKFALGWGNQYVVSSEGTYRLSKFQETGDSIIIPFGTNFEGSAMDEYLMLEYYTPDYLNEFDTVNWYNTVKGINESGLKVYHVDSRITQIYKKSTYSYDEFYYPQYAKHLLQYPNAFTTYRHNNPSLALGTNMATMRPMLNVISSVSEVGEERYITDNFENVFPHPHFEEEDLLNVNDTLLNLRDGTPRKVTLSNSKRKPLYDFTVTDITDSYIEIEFKKVK